MLYQAPSPQRKKEPPPRENKLRLFLKRSSEPLLNLQNAAQQVKVWWRLTSSLYILSNATNHSNNVSWTLGGSIPMCIWILLSIRSNRNYPNLTTHHEALVQRNSERPETHSSHSEIPQSPRIIQIHTHTHTYIRIYLHFYVYLCTCTRYCTFWKWAITVPSAPHSFTSVWKIVDRIGCMSSRLKLQERCSLDWTIDWMNLHDEEKIEFFPYKSEVFALSRPSIDTIGNLTCVFFMNFPPPFMCKQASHYPFHPHTHNMWTKMFTQPKYRPPHSANSMFRLLEINVCIRFYSSNIYIHIFIWPFVCL